MWILKLRPEMCLISSNELNIEISRKNNEEGERSGVYSSIHKNKAYKIMYFFKQFE